MVRLTPYSLIYCIRFKCRFTVTLWRESPPNCSWSVVFPHGVSDCFFQFVPYLRTQRGFSNPSFLSSVVMRFPPFCLTLQPWFKPQTRCSVFSPSPKLSSLPISLVKVMKDQWTRLLPPPSMFNPQMEKPFFLKMFGERLLLLTNQDKEYLPGNSTNPMAPRAPPILGGPREIFFPPRRRRLPVE